MLTLFLKSGLLLPYKSHLHPHPIPSLSESLQDQRSFAFLTSGCHFPFPPRPKQQGLFLDFVLFLRAGVHTSGVLHRCDIQRKYYIVPIRIVISNSSPWDKRKLNNTWMTWQSLRLSRFKSGIYKEDIIKKSLRTFRVPEH